MLNWLRQNLSTKTPKEMRTVLLDDAKRDIVHVQSWLEKYASDAQMLQARIDRLTQELENHVNQ